MAAELIAGLGALKTAFDMAKGLKDINDATIRNGAVIELQEKILAAQTAQSALLERVSDLEKEVADFETWETEKKRYELTEVGTGAFTLLLKPSMQSTEPAHCICTQCYEERRKSVLQIAGNLYGSVRLKCPRCKSEINAQEDHPNYPFKREYVKQSPTGGDGPGGDFMTR